MNKFFEIKGILRQASKHEDYRSNSTDYQQTFQVEYLSYLRPNEIIEWFSSFAVQSIPTNELDSFSQVQQENTRLKVAFSHR